MSPLEALTATIRELRIVDTHEHLPLERDLPREADMIESCDAVPANKIMGFGGEYCFPEGVYGHQALARMLFIDNPVALFGLRSHG